MSCIESVLNWRTNLVCLRYCFLRICYYYFSPKDAFRFGPRKSWVCVRKAASGVSANLGILRGVGWVVCVWRERVRDLTNTFPEFIRRFFIARSFHGGRTTVVSSARMPRRHYFLRCRATAQYAQPGVLRLVDPRSTKICLWTNSMPAARVAKCAAVQDTGYTHCERFSLVLVKESAITLTTVIKYARS